MQLVNAKKVPRIEDLGEGSVQLVATEPEDMWHANNLIAVDDVVRAHAIRKVSKESATGTSSTERIHTDLTIAVTSTFFDPSASSLHVSGKVVVANAFVSAGQYHTLDLELNRPFTLWKKHGWDSVALQTLRDALNQDRDGAIAAVVMDEHVANICLITEFQTLLRQRVSGSGGGKGKPGSSKEDKAVRRYFEKTLSTLMRSVDFSQPRPLLLASPAFVATNFKQYIAEEGARLADKKLSSLAKNITIAPCSNGSVHSLNEVLKKREVLALMKQRKSTSETKYLDELAERIRNDDGRAWYGVLPVAKAVQEGAVGRGGGVLLVNNDLFRSQDIATRKQYVALVDKVREDGGDVRVLSSDHQSGKRLEGMGGIAAILTYPLFDLDDPDDGANGVLDDLETTII
ncbi:eRF1 domain 1-domain-containing protein [Coniella lustricola]|uniref:Protein DOM34 homolog n=1 Tax=Coniella lustricola TaxID=2025994 RepID=A0A2T2ZYP4_9PEZI|nr:eRF1 domain 1-domain-containing protein [Coniella lustricola]